MTMKPGKRTHEGAELTLGETGLRVPHPELLREITAVYTQPEQRGQGHANWLLSLVCAEADREFTVLMISPQPYGDSPAGAEALQAWYERHGFVVGQQNPVIMVRPPRKPQCH